MKTKLAFVKRTALVLLLTTFNVQLSTAFAQGTAFTYQGRLNNGGAPTTGTYDLVFTIYDLPTGPGAFANQTNSATPVSNGLFTVTLDFGPGIFTGPERWLEIAVRTNGSGAFTNLAPRQKITATPYAVTAGNVSGSVSASQLSGPIAPANIGAGTITSTMLAAGSVTTSNLADGAVNLAKLNTVAAWTPSIIFTNPTPAIDDDFGLVMAAFGTDKVLISTIWDSPGISGAGAAHLFSTNGSLLMTFTNPAPVQEDLFGIAMDAVGPDKVLIAAYGKDIGATNAGVAYLFSTNGSLLTTFTNPTPELGDEFGRAVTEVGGNRVLIAAAFDDTGATNAGAAYLFNLNGTLLVTFTNPAPATDDWFGYHVISVGTDKVLIAAPLDSSFGLNAGAAYLYSTNGTLLTTVTNPSPGQVVFGAGLASVGSDKFIIAALLDATNGVAYLFNTNGTRLATFGPALGLNFSLAWVRPDKVAINVPTGPGGASFVYIFNTNGTQLATLSNPSQINNDLFAYTLAAVGDRVVVGAPQNSTGALESGIAYLFGANAAYVPGLISQGVLDGSITAASLGNVAIDSSKITDGTISTVDLADGSVTDAKIASVDASKITTGTLADGRLSPNVALLNANQLFTGQNTLNNPANSFSGNGSGLTNVNALTLGGIGSSSFWRTVGNAGTTPGPNFLGTTDNQPLEIQVNSTRALRLEPHGASAPSLAGGYFQNSATPIGAVVAGGGTSGSPNYALGNYSFIGAGHGGQASHYSAVVAGAYNVSLGQLSFIGSGQANTNLANYSFIGGGSNNLVTALADSAFIGGGAGNSIQTGATLSVLGGGNRNSIQTDAFGSFLGGGGDNSIQRYGVYTVLSGGWSNSIQPYATYSFLGGGFNNSIQSYASMSVLGGGTANTIQTDADFSVLGGGQGNSIRSNAIYSVLGGGYNNSIQTNATHSVLGGGSGNSIQPNAGTSFLGGGANNSIQANAYLSVLSGGANNFILPNAVVSVLGGGSDNSIRPFASYSVLGGGQNNVIQTNAYYSVLSGGYQNSLLNNGQYATIPGGQNNTATNYAFAAGYNAKATNTGAFVWSDGTGTVTGSAANNAVTFRASGGYRIFTDTGTAGAQLLAGATAWSVMSDRNMKKDFATVDAVNILEKLAGIPITQWRYNWENAQTTPHIGPMAQDFKHAFYPGSDDKSITTLEADGVALAAIQGLNQKLETENAELRARLEKLERLVDSLAAKK